MIGSDGERARVLAFWNSDEAGPHFEYDVAATACERTAREGLCHIPRGMPDAFPGFPLYRELGVESYLGVPLRDASDTILGFLVVLHDTPMEFSPAAESILRVFAARAAAELERKHAEEIARRRLAELAHVTRLGTMGEMISELAHEINQPLYAIGNFAEACVSTLQVNVPDTRREVLPWMQQILEQTRRVGQIVRRLGRYVRRAPPRRTGLDLNELVQDVIQFLEIDERWKAVRLTLELEEPLPRVSGDRVQIEQVLVNLLLNAVDAMSDLEPEQRALTVKTSHIDDDWIKVLVRDNGRGIRHDRELDRMFEPFFTTKPEGMGMGLAISRSLIQEHRGRLWATPNPDRGLTFRFTLPIRRKEDGDDIE
jgi:C4-dicarboxylate-specific signal transduction histidine kinase